MIQYQVKIWIKGELVADFQLPVPSGKDKNQTQEYIGNIVFEEVYRKKGIYWMDVYDEGVQWTYDQVAA